MASVLRGPNQENAFFFDKYDPQKRTRVPNRYNKSWLYFKKNAN